MHTIFFGSNESTTKYCNLHNYVDACEIYELLCQNYLYVQLIHAITGVCKTWKDPKAST